MATVKRMCWPPGGGVPWIETQKIPTQTLTPHEIDALEAARRLPEEDRARLLRVLDTKSTGWLRYRFEEAFRHLDLAGDLCPATGDGEVCTYCAADTRHDSTTFVELSGRNPKTEVVLDDPRRSVSMVFRQL